jgi:polyhydroxyalkanoate synthesis regulator phasin
MNKIIPQSVKGGEIATKVAKEVYQEAAKLIEQKAEQWLSENKLIHAGAASQLANQLKQKIKETK